MPEDREDADEPAGSPPGTPSGTGRDVDRLDRLVMARVRRFIGLRDVLDFTTLGFLYSRGRRRPIAKHDTTEDPDR